MFSGGLDFSRLANRFTHTVHAAEILVIVRRDRFESPNRTLLLYTEQIRTSHRAEQVLTSPLDSWEGLNTHCTIEIFDDVCRFFGFFCLKTEYVGYFRTRRGWHVIARLRGRRIPPFALVAMQILLGSDRRREKLNLRRAMFIGRDTYRAARWQVLFARKL